MGLISPWHPIKDAVDLKHLGKLAEESNELGSAIARCIIQGVDECHPVTGKSNRSWLEDEMADVIAGITLCEERFGLNVDVKRIEEKLRDLRRWHKDA